jgi:PAS domain S-box-containing protein
VASPHISQQDQLFRLLVSNVKDYAIYALDVNGKIISWNAGAHEIHGFTEDEAIGLSFSAFYPESQNAESAAKHDLDLSAADGRYEREGWLTRRDGKKFWANTLITPLIESKKVGICGYGILTRDLSQQLHAAEELRRSDEAFDLVVSSVKDYAIFLLDPDGKVVTWNQGAQRIKGYTASEIVGKSFSTFYPQTAKDIGHPQHELKLAVENGHYEEEAWRVRKDGSEFWASVTITPVYDAKSKLRGFIKVTKDLTERRRAELELQRARDEAVRASQLKSQFVANISHEIRTPMAGIIGMAEILLQDENLNDEQREAAEHIFLSSRRLLEVLNDILDFSKLEAGRVEIAEDSFSIQAVLREVMDSIAVPASKKSLEIKLHVADGVPDQMTGDEGKIRQCLLNFAHNAIKFTSKGHVLIDVSTAKHDGRDLVRFEVKDTGIGIDPEAQERLFEPFVQADGSIRRKFAGTGLGLSITKGFVTLMKGDFGFSSEPNVGSTFWFAVPIKVSQNG